MPREINNHDKLIEAFQYVDIVSELVDKLPNGEFRNELDMDIILFGRSYRGHKVGPYARLLEFGPGENIVRENTWESSIFYILVKGRLDATVSEADGTQRILGEVTPGNSFGEMALRQDNFHAGRSGRNPPDSLRKCRRLQFRRSIHEE
ncbi:MAG: cyclic nucleotide-binding domain-containing protein, partial [Acidobacteriota bacterium]